MSSTLRSKDHNFRREGIADYYVTPIPVIESFLKHFFKVNGLKPEELTILDPCAGGDSKHPMSYSQTLINLGCCTSQIHTVDKREDSLAQHKFDYLTNGLSPKLKAIKFNLIISNPPFLKALEFIETSLKTVMDSGFVVFLLRLNFLGGVGRKEFFKNHMPEMICVHPKRISFTDDKKTDSIEYAHFVWRKEANPESTKLFILE